MFKVIIADDEPKVCQLIEKLGNWEELGLVVSAVAHNGIDAFNLIKELQPDIVITDIRMPGMDGLELIKRVKEHGLEPYFIIVSGYRHFDYAYNAIKYNVTEYLLKPIKKHELNEVLRKICSSLQANKLRMASEHDIKNQLQKSRLALRGYFVNDVISEPEKLEEKTLDDINREYHLNFQPDYFQAIYIKLDSNTSDDRYLIENKILEKVADIGLKILSEYCHELCAQSTRSGVVIIVNYDENAEPKIKKCLKRLYDKIALYVGIFGNISLTIGVGEAQRQPAFTGKSFRSAADAVRCRLVMGINRILCAADLKFTGRENVELINLKREKQLANIFETLDTEAFSIWLGEVFSGFAADAASNPLPIFAACEKIATILVQSTRDFEPEPGTGASFLHKFTTGLDEVKSIHEMHAFVRQMAIDYLTLLLEGRRLQDNKPVRVAKQYIAEHYREQIKLEDVARQVHLNPVYFSTIFKKETGMNFSDYLINYRLDVAKDLLKTTGLSMAEIAGAVGYLDTKYFSKLFTKVVGIKPSEYRKLYS